MLNYVVEYKFNHFVPIFRLVNTFESLTDFYEATQYHFQRHSNLNTVCSRI